VVFERNGLAHDWLGGGKPTPEAAADAKSTLEKSWDIETTDHLLQQLEWLEHGGHVADFEKSFREVGKLSEKDLDAKAARFDDADDRAVLKARWRHAARVAKFKGGLAGWDLSRYVALCRWGYAAGYLTQEEAWKRMDKVVKDLQKAYTSWEELGEAYCIGYECWKGASNEATVKAFDKLKSAADSPWRSTPWKLKLVSLEKPEKVAEPKKKP
jgi:hypothetical protein